ncbi:MAG TPA: RHS repeat-associated core domain-containing protein [Candidatus Methylomirabilis sp.]|nr:RHS repeat-associated core domain-containing protein [Candidatus Methylomirabilis sp.]
MPGSGGTVSFKYDPFGRRIYKSSSSGTSVYAYDGDNLVEETNSPGTAVARYEDTQNIDEPLAMLRSSATSYYDADGLGSVTSMASSAGALASTYTYDSFGNVTSSTGTLINPFRYTGREFDAEIGLYYYRNRYYDQTAGRFVSEDPIRYHGGIDFYAYVANRPLSRRDPFGLSPGWSWLWKVGKGAKDAADNAVCAVTCVQDCILRTLDNAACQRQAEGNLPPQLDPAFQANPTTSNLDFKNLTDAIAGNAACEMCRKNCLSKLPIFGWF